MRHSRGNILFLILLAVVLFAALSYAVTSSMRGGGKDANSENAKTAAAAITQYMTLVRSELQRLMLVNNCGLNNIDWRTEAFKRFNNSYYTITSTLEPPAVPKIGCALFTDYGGSIAPQTFDQYAATGYNSTNISPTGGRPGHFAFRWVYRINEGTSANDIALIAAGLRPDICAYLLNPNNPPAQLPTEPFGTDYDAVVSDPGALVMSAPTKSIGNDPANLYGDIFVKALTGGGTVNNCLFGMIVVSR